MRKLCLLIFALWIMSALGAAWASAALPTHVGQPTYNLVTLTLEDSEYEPVCKNGSIKNRDLFRVWPSGNVATIPFRVPKGYHFIVTDVEWSAYGGVNGTPQLLPDHTLGFSISIGDSGNPVFHASLPMDASIAAGRPGTSEYATTGFVVAEGKGLCLYAAATSPTSILTAWLDRVIIRGYLIEY